MNNVIQFGKQSLTSVTITTKDKKKHFSLRLPTDNEGRAHINQTILQSLLDKVGVKRGESYSIS